MSETSAASFNGAQQNSAPPGILSKPNTETNEPSQEEGWGSDYGTPGEMVESVDDIGNMYSPGVELDDSSKNRKNTKEEAPPEAKTGKEPENKALSAEQRLKVLEEERSNFKKGVYDKFQKLAAENKRLAQKEQQLTLMTQQIQDRFMKNPLDVYDAIGGTPEQKVAWIEAAVNQLHTEMQKTPEQRELEKFREKEAKFKEYSEKQQQQQSQQQEQAQVQQLQEGLSKFMIEAFTKRVGLPATPERVRQMAMSLADYYEADEPVDIERVADEAFDGFRTDVRHSLAKMPADKLIEFVGEEAARSIAAQLGQKMSVNQHFKNHKQSKQPSAPNSAAEPKWLGYSDVAEMRRQGKI